MRLPAKREERHAVYRDLIRRCSVSREERKGQYRTYRSKYLTGSDTQDPEPYNRLFEHVQDTSADCFAPDGVRFGIALPPHYGHRWIEEQEAARDELHRMMHDTSALLVYDMAVEWAFPYPTSVVKLIVNRNQPQPVLVPDPSDIGVLEERMDEWDDQEALTHHYEMNLAAFERLIRAGIPDEKYRAEVLMQARGNARPSSGGGTEALGPTMSRVILSAASPTMTGTANMGGWNPAQPASDEPVVELCELWVWDDELLPLCDTCHRVRGDLVHSENAGPLYDHAFVPSGDYEGDYRVVTVLVSSMNEPVLWEPPNSMDPGHHIFYGLTLNPTPGYIWGLSEVERLWGLQRWRSTAETELNKAIGRNLDPSLIGLGVQGVGEEKMVKLKQRGGIAAFPPGTTDIKPFTVPIPPEAEQRPARIDAMFDKASGRRARTAEPGARSGEQEFAKAALGGGPTRKKAMRCEGVLGAVATGLLRIQRRVMKTTLTKKNGEQFLLSQMPGDFTAKVVGNSASPLFRQELLAKIAFAAGKSWLDADEGIELLQLPMADILAAKAAKRAEAQAEAGTVKLKAEKDKGDAALVRAQAQAEKAKNGGTV